MKWTYWIDLYIRTHCVARGLRPLTLVAYENALKQFREWIRVTRINRPPDRHGARRTRVPAASARVRGNGDRRSTARRRPA